MKTLVFAVFVVFAYFGVSNCEEYNELKCRIAAKYETAVPVQWGENLDGILIRLDTKEKVVALTFDACGSKNDGFDLNLFDYLVKHKVPVTFFISGRWIDRHPKEFKLITSNSLFDIENHGLEHKPASVNGRSVYGIIGAENPGEFIDEVELNAQKIEKLTGRKPV
jgi:peptidoglycan/xylan/chitin deacetylase (PgdA/CDA1 family)